MFVRCSNLVALILGLALLGTASLAAAQYTRMVICTTYPSGLVICR
jgi:hypothetical protein